MKCPKCGSEINENQKFCSSCGTKINRDVSGEDILKNTNQFDLKQFIKKNIILTILTSIVIISITTFSSFKIIDYYKKIKPYINILNSEVGTIKLSAKYNKKNKEVNFLITQNNVIIENWQLEYSQYSIPESTLSIKQSNGDLIDTFEYNGLELILNKPVIVKFKISNQTLDDFVSIKYLLKDNSIVYTVPYFISSNQQERLTAQKELEEYNAQIIKAEREKLEEQKTINLVQKYAYKGGYGEEEFEIIDYNPRKCLFKVKEICFGRPFYAKGMSYSDCKNNKDKLGIQSCVADNDIFASSAFVCGGVQNMPTPDELVILAQDLYANSNINNLIEIGHEHCLNNSYRSCNEVKALRNNSKPYLEYFKEIYTTNTDFHSSQEEKDREELSIIILSTILDGDDRMLVQRRFHNYGTALHTDYRAEGRMSYDRHNWRNPYSICIQRDENYIKPIEAKYPIKVKELSIDKEVVNELF